MFDLERDTPWSPKRPCFDCRISSITDSFTASAPSLSHCSWPCRPDFKAYDVLTGLPALTLGAGTLLAILPFVFLEKFDLTDFCDLLDLLDLCDIYALIFKLSSLNRLMRAFMSLLLRASPRSSDRTLLITLSTSR